MRVDVLVAPPVPALLPANASLAHPLPELRPALDDGVRRLFAAAAPVAVVGSGPSPDDLRRGVSASVAERVATHLLAPAQVRVEPVVPSGARAVLVLGNGSAKRTEKAPGHLDDRAEGFDASLGKALAAADGHALAETDLDLASDLWADAGPLAALGRHLASSALAWEAEVLLDAAPFGVQYWVVHLVGTPAGD